MFILSGLLVSKLQNRIKYLSFFWCKNVIMTDINWISLFSDINDSFGGIFKKQTGMFLF